MKLGIMQPYIFPYIGYYQLINSVDKFLIYDDVSFIKQGWINRNTILLNGERHTFTVPIKNASSFTPICETKINLKLYDQWKAKFMKTLMQAYKKAPFFEETYSLVGHVFNNNYNSISELASNSLVETCRWLGIETEFLFTVHNYDNNFLKGKDRVIDICKKEKADVYINLIGGIELYAIEDFHNVGLTLKFIKTGNITYMQFNANFINGLSIIDLMMFNPKEKIKEFLNEYELISV